jgi:hypothetical protein
MYPQMGLLFHPTTPALAPATISKTPLKPLPPPQHRCRHSENAKTLIEYHAVALELVREHPWLTDGRLERARASGCAEDRGEACGPMHAVPHALLLGSWAVS